MAVSFSKDIKPLFREVDIDHMKVHGVNLDDYQYMSDATAQCTGCSKYSGASNDASWRPILDPRAARSVREVEVGGISALITSPRRPSASARPAGKSSRPARPG